MSISSDINFFDALLILASLMFSLIIPFESKFRKDFEYDFVVAPNADANQIPLDFTDSKKVMVDDGCMITEFILQIITTRRRLRQRFCCNSENLCYDAGII